MKKIVFTLWHQDFLDVKLFLCQEIQIMLIASRCPNLRGVTKKKRDCCHENFNTTFLGKLQIVPFKVVPL